jgi:hypothetical protein
MASFPLIAATVLVALGSKPKYGLKNVVLLATVKYEPFSRLCGGKVKSGFPPDPAPSLTDSNPYSDKFRIYSFAKTSIALGPLTLPSVRGPSITPVMTSLVGGSALGRKLMLGSEDLLGSELGDELTLGSDDLLGCKDWLGWKLGSNDTDGSELGDELRLGCKDTLGCSLG